jgi:hypothetical protein
MAVQPVWEIHPQPFRDGLGEGREDDLVELSTLAQLIHRLDRVLVPEVAVDVDAPATKVVQELAQPMLGVLGGQRIDGRVAGGGSDGSTPGDAGGEVGRLGVGTSR